MTSPDGHDVDKGPVLLGVETFEHAVDELLTPGPLELSPFLDVDGGVDEFCLQGDLPSPIADSVHASVELSGGAAVSKVSHEPPASGSSPDKADPVARGKKRRANTNQAEVQKRYRERKKSKLQELERTVAELREQVRSLRSKSRSGSGPPSTTSDPESDVAEKELSSGGSGDDIVSLLEPHAHYELSFPPEPVFPERPGDPALEKLEKPEANPSSGSGAIMRDVAAAAISTYAASNGRAPHLHPCFAMALEAGEVLRDGPGTKKKAPVSFRSYAEVELFYADQQTVYDLSVEKLKGLMQVGASDDIVRAAVLDIVDVLSDARRQRPDVSFFTTQQAQIQMMNDDFAPADEAPNGRGGFSKHCPTSCAYMMKSVVDRKLMKGEWPRIVRSVCEALPPKDVTAICDWGTEFLRARRDVLLLRVATMSQHAKLERSSFTGDPTIFGLSAAEVKADRDTKEGVYNTLFEGLQEEMRLHHEGTMKLFSTLPPRSAAAIIILTHPVALDTFSLATELKRVRGVEPGELKWLFGDHCAVAVTPEGEEAPSA